MDEQAIPGGFHRVGEVHRDNVLIGRYRNTTADGTVLYAIGLTAYNASADRWKLVYFSPGLGESESAEKFEIFQEAIAGYSWEEDDIIPWCR